jgi:hypothetical protein
MCPAIRAPTAKDPARAVRATIRIRKEAAKTAKVAETRIRA